MYSLKQIAEITNCRFEGTMNPQIQQYLCDSRQLQSPENSLFVAIKSARNNGHHYISDLIKKGVKAFLIEENEFNYDSELQQGIAFLISTTPLLTLQNLAAYHRQQFSIPVIGISGSNGKTMVKEWLYQLLKPEFSICRSPKSYNSQLGVPLSVLNLNSSHNLGIFEAGISLPGEMEHLASIIRPTMALITSIGSAHDEGFNDRKQKLSEKLKLSEGADKVLLNGIPKNEVESSANRVFISENEHADVQISFDAGILTLKTTKNVESYAIPFSDSASIRNISTCICVLREMAYSENTIKTRVAELQALSLRLEIKNGIHNSVIINDYYNSDLDSMKIALNFLGQQNKSDKKIVIVSDIEQSGMSAVVLYEQLAALFKSSHIQQVIGIGNEISAHGKLFHHTSLFFKSTREFIHALPSLGPLFSRSGILLKGARSFGFEDISRLLQLKSHDTVFEINLNKLTDNVNYYRSLISNKVHLMCMVKAMGYGSGSVEVARVLQHIGVNYLAVAYADEGVELREAGIHLPIMVMSPEEDAFADMINYKLEPEIYSFKVLKSFVEQLDAMGMSEPFPIHLKMDTGMHRLGFEQAELPELLNQLKHHPQLKVRSVFSHLAASDNTQLDAFSKEQIQVFEKAITGIENELGYSFLKHICNSAAISRFPQAHYSMVRLGIGMYGIGVLEKEQQLLQPIGKLKTRISQIKMVSKGESVSYNRSGNIEQDTRIAILPIGYADGFSRLLGNGKHGVYIQGHFCKTIGNICMDMCMVDITNITCAEGDEVVIFENTQHIQNLAIALKTIPYEVLTNVSARVKRVYLQE